MLTPNTYPEYIRYVALHGHRPQGGPWAGPGYSWCVELVDAAGNFGYSYPNAALAGNASGPLHNQPAIGEFLYWSDHIGIYTGHDVMVCASSAIPGGSGAINILEWEKHFPHQQYRGATARFGPKTLTVTPNPSPKPNPTFWRKDMSTGFVRQTSTGTIAAVNPITGQKRPLGSLAEWLAYNVNGALAAELTDAQYAAIPTEAVNP